MGTYCMRNSIFNARTISVWMSQKITIHHCIIYWCSSFVICKIYVCSILNKNFRYFSITCLNEWICLLLTTVSQSNVLLVILFILSSRLKHALGQKYLNFFILFLGCGAIKQPLLHFIASRIRYQGYFEYTLILNKLPIERAKCNAVFPLLSAWLRSASFSINNSVISALDVALCLVTPNLFLIRSAEKLTLNG